MSAAGTYQLGVDLGTTYTAAAVARGAQHRMVGLGNRSSAIPSVVHLADDGSVRAGDAADRRGPSEPDRVAREFKRRLGDPTPLLLGGTPCSAEALLGTLLDAVVTRVSALEGGPPSHLTVTRPANWGPYKQELFEHCVRVAGVDTASTLTEPEAAAISYAANERVEPGSLVAVYDLGGGTFDVAILRKTADGFSILGRPEGIERLGGIDFDEAVLGHVRGALGDALEALDVDDPTVMTALARLRRDCTEAKEALSGDSEVAVPVLLPGVQTEVRLTRAEFERMVRPTLNATIDAMRRAMVAAAVEPGQISTVLLVGGSSRIPLVADLVSRAFGRPVAVDAHPKHAIALGAAQAATLTARDALETTDPQHAPNDAQIIAFSTPAAATGGHTPRSDNAAADATTARVATTAEAPAPAPDAAPATARRRRQWDRRPYDDVPTQVPSWVVSTPRQRRSRRRLWTGIVAFVALSVLAIGAGAFVTSDPRSEARGDTPATRGTPATEWHGARPARDAGAADTPVADAELSGARADRGTSRGQAGGAAPTTQGDDRGATRTPASDRATAGAGTAEPDQLTPDGPDPGAGDVDPEATAAPVDPDPGDPGSEGPTESPSPPADGSDEQSGSSPPETNATEDPLRAPVQAAQS